MKKFKELTIEQLTEIVNRSKKLRDELDEYIQDCEMCWISEKLAVMKDSLSDWSIGFYNQNYIRVKDYGTFLDCVIDSEKRYGASDKMEKLISQCEKLRGSNLFEYWAKKLKEVYFEDELQSICKYVEDCSYELYQGSVGEKCESYLECFFDAYDDYLYDESTSTFYKPMKLAAA